MAYYHYLKSRSFDSTSRARAAGRLLSLRKALGEQIPPKQSRDTLLLATWNLREFDGASKGYGPRLPESFHYIAEVISAFDLVAIQEIKRDLRPLQRLVRILGPTWDYVASDITEGVSGNTERMAFLFDRGKVQFRNVVGEIVLTKSEQIETDRQFARTPFFVAFQAGWFRFNLATVHIYYGSDSGAELQRRIEEIQAIAKALSKRADKEPDNYIVLGDFNIKHPEHETRKALTDNGFFIPEPLLSIPTNRFGTHYYDQIAFKTKKDELMLGDGIVQEDGEKHNAGTFDFFRNVFKPSDENTYFEALSDERKAHWNLDSDDEPRSAADRTKYYENWKTFQMSDHLPMWVELKVDFSERYLRKLAEGA